MHTVCKSTDEYPSNGPEHAILGEAEGTAPLVGVAEGAAGAGGPADSHDVPSSVGLVPTGHMKHVDEPDMEIQPSEHLLQLTLPQCDHVPGSHAVHVPDGGDSPSVPGSHFEHVDEPEKDIQPSEHRLLCFPYSLK